MKINGLAPIGILWMVWFWSCNTTKLVQENEFLLQKTRINISEKSNVKAEDIEPYMKQHPNTRTAIFFPFHLWVYNLANSGKETKLKKWLGIYKMGNIIGESPIIFSDYKARKSAFEMKTYLHNKGYFNSAVDYTVDQHGKKASITYNVLLNSPYVFSNLDYDIVDKKILFIIKKDSANSLIKPNKPYDIDLLENERKRIVLLLKNNGYYNFNKDFITFLADSNHNKVAMTMLIGECDQKNKAAFNKARQQYKVGKIYYFMDYSPKQVLNNPKQFYSNMDTITFDNQVFFLYHNDWFISPKVLYKRNYQKPDSLYKYDNTAATYDYLWKLGTYRLINIRFVEDTIKERYLNCYVELTPLKKYSFSAEIEGTNTSGNLGVSGNLKLSDRSLLDHAEKFDINIHTGFQRQTVFSTSGNNGEITEYLPFNTVEEGIDAGLKIPQFWLPFNSAKFIRKHFPYTVLNASVNYQKRPEYENQIIVSSFGYMWNVGKKILNTFNLIELNSVYVRNIDVSFQNRINGTFLQSSFENHMITATNYTFQFNNENINKIQDAFYFRLKLESSGNILYAIEQNANASQTDGHYTLFNLPYSNYFKTDLDFSFYNKISQKQTLAYRVFGGLAIPYGNLNVIPFEKRYYGGGANGIRAWQIRSLGPGAYSDNSMVYPNLSGDMLLEASAEYRFHMFWLLNGAFFVDAGNIWSVSKEDDRQGSKFYIDQFYKQIAVGTGFGLRFDFTVFVLRIDMGLKLRDPSLADYQRWILNTRKFNSSDLTWNLGIGYPF